MCIKTDFILIYEWYSRQQNTQECRSYSVVRPLLEQNFVKGQLTQFTKSICIIAGGNSVIIHSCLVCLPTREAPTHYWDFCETSVRTNPSAISTRAQITWRSSLLFWVISLSIVKSKMKVCCVPNQPVSDHCQIQYRLPFLNPNIILQWVECSVTSSSPTTLNLFSKLDF